jgi:equilibrative nucleoside transporter 1/2/3
MIMYKMVKLVHIEFAILGLGILLTWNALVSTLDWLNLEYPGGEVSFIFPIIWYIPFLIFQPLTIWRGSRFSFNIRLVPSFIIRSLFMVSVYIFATLMSESVGYILTIIAILIQSTFDSIAEATLYGLTGMLSESYAHAYMIGMGFAGVGISLLRVVCLASFNHEPGALLKSTLVYYIISAAYLLLCVPVQLHIMHNSHVIEHLQKLKEEVDRISPEREETNNIASSYFYLFLHIRKELLILWFIFTTTNSLFPGLSIATESPEMSYSWFVTIIVLISNLGDLIGKYLPYHVLCTTR